MNNPAMVCFLLITLMYFLPPIPAIYAGNRDSNPPETIKTLINKHGTGFRLVELQDFVPAIRNYAKEENNPSLLQTFIETDFNDDGQKDLVGLIVNTKSGIFKFVIYLKNKNTYKEVTLSQSKLTDKAQGGVWRIMELKKKGSPGLATRMYFCESCSASEKQTLIRDYTSHTALETWNGTGGNLPDAELDSLAYCSQAYYFKRDQIKSVDVCD